jgi:hypothetical protein
VSSVSVPISATWYDPTTSSMDSPPPIVTSVTGAESLKPTVSSGSSLSGSSLGLNSSGMEMRADGTARMRLSQISVASQSRRLCLSNNKREIRQIAPKAKTASNINVAPSHTAKQILAANNKTYPLRRLRIDFICTIPPSSINFREGCLKKHRSKG